MGVSAKKNKCPNRHNVNSKAAFTTDLHERDRDFFFGHEIDLLLEEAKKNRHGVRDHLILLMLYLHGYRVSELLNTQVDDIDLKRSRIWVRRVKGSLSTEQPILGHELRAVKRYLKVRNSQLPWLFVSERKQQLGRQSINQMLRRLGKRTGLHAYPHKFRHSCGFYLADRGNDFRVIQDYLGHRDPKHTMRYTRIAGTRFQGLWTN